MPYREAGTAEELAHTFSRITVSSRGMPQEIISDRDKLFAPDSWKSLMRQLGAGYKVATTGHAQTDGQTERVNQIV